MFTFFSAADAQAYAVKRFRRLMTLYRVDLEPLRGKDLMCFCSVGSLYCHADVLLELANVKASRPAGG